MILKWLIYGRSFRRMLDKRVLINVVGLLFGTIFFLAVFQINISNPTQQISRNIIPPYILNIVNTTYIYPTNHLPVEDYSTLIDLRNFQFDIVTNCTNSTFLLILVHTARDHINKRNTIRSTWGSQVNKDIKIIFVVGKASGDSDQLQLEKEQEIYNDIIQGNFVDNYRNMTYKHTMSLKFSIYHCPQATYILKIDDDVFVNMPFLLNYLNIELSPLGARNLLFCVPLSRSPVRRSYRSKWRVSYHDFSEKYFPTYCPGWALLYSPDVLFILYKAVQNSKYFWIDDVFITGILAKQENILHTNMQPFVLSNEALNEDIFKHHSYNSSFIFSSPNLKVTEIYDLWYFLQNCTMKDCLYYS